MTECPYNRNRVSLNRVQEEGVQLNWLGEVEFRIYKSLLRGHSTLYYFAIIVAITS